MTSLNNEDVCRKSSVYNQTGQSYFQQLTAYNHMSAHLRRLVLAPSVVDSRNKKYARDRDKHQQRHGSRCSCCFRVRRRNLIEGLAYDTKHHPSDALRMNLKRNNSGCRSKHNNRSSAPRERTGRGEHIIGNKFDRDAVEYFETPASRSPRSNGEPSRRNSSEGQYESHTDSEFDSPIVNDGSVDVAGNNKPPTNDRADKHSDEAKYAKFIYDITREIMINGLYTDEELQAIFEKHFRINYDLLDKDKMRSEIDQLKTSLNLTADCSEDEEENNPRFADLGRFAAPSASNGSSTRSKALYRNKFAERIRDTFEESGRLKNVLGGENAVDLKSELYIAERDIVVALMEMKLDPQQIQTIRKSLRNRIRDTTVPSKTVQVDVKRNYDEHKKKERTNLSSTLMRPEWRTSQLFRLSDPQLGDNKQNGSSGGVVGSDRISLPKHRHHCQCRCGQDTEIVDDLETRESISSSNIERESQRENDKRTRKSSEEHLVAKIAKNIDAASTTAAISVIPSQKELSTKSEEKYDAAGDNIATSNDETRSASADVETNIQRETSCDDLASISECSSETDEVEIVEELMQISEEEETNDGDDVSIAVDK